MCWNEIRMVIIETKQGTQVLVAANKDRRILLELRCRLFDGFVAPGGLDEVKKTLPPLAEALKRISRVLRPNDYQRPPIRRN